MNTPQLVIALLAGFLGGAFAVLGGWLLYWMLGVAAGVVLAFLGTFLMAGTVYKTYTLATAG